MNATADKAHARKVTKRRPPAPWIIGAILTCVLIALLQKLILQPAWRALEFNPGVYGGELWLARAPDGTLSPCPNPRVKRAPDGSAVSLPPDLTLYMIRRQDPEVAEIAGKLNERLPDSWGGNEPIVKGYQVVCTLEVLDPEGARVPAVEADLHAGKLTIKPNELTRGWQWPLDKDGFFDLRAVQERVIYPAWKKFIAGLAALAVLLPVLGLCIWRSITAWRGARRAARDLCVACGYPRAGRSCPECGDSHAGV